MSLPPGCSVRVRCPSGLRYALLALLLLLTPREPVVDAAPFAVVQGELRCICLTVTTGVHPRMISNLQVLAAGPQCPSVQIVVSLKNGNEVCLDPKAPLIKKIVQKILDSGNKKLIKRNEHALEKLPSLQ